jgi:hypothetical protein
MKQLNLILKVNSVSSGITGFVMVVFSQFCSTVFGVDANSGFIGIGIFLIAFAIFVFTESNKEKINGRNVKIISTLDILWVLISCVILVAFWKSLSALGNLLIIVMALWVDTMAYLQLTRLNDF